MSTESLNFIDDEILVTEFIAFMEVMSAKCFEQGDALKAEEGHIGILIEGTIFKNDPFDSKHGTYADMMVNMNIKKKMISLRTRRNSTRRTTKNKFESEEESIKKERFGKPIISNEKNEPKLIFNDFC